MFMDNFLERLEVTEDRIRQMNELDRARYIDLITKELVENEVVVNNQRLMARLVGNRKTKILQRIEQIKSHLAFVADGDF